MAQKGTGAADHTGQADSREPDRVEVFKEIFFSLLLTIRPNILYYSYINEIFSL